MVRTVITTERFENGELIERTVEETSDEKPVGMVNVHVSLSLPESGDITRIADSIASKLEEVIKYEK